MKLADYLDAQALRARIELEPIDGPGGRVFPPTYPSDDNRGQKARHVVEALPDGQRRVLIDSVASQANRQEAALIAARDAGEIDFADIYVDLSGPAPELKRLSATAMPHRLSDAILRDSEFDDGLPFSRSPIGKAILGASPLDLSPILESSPTTVLFGCWFSQHNLPRPLKLQRCTVSDIWAENAVLGQSVGSRIDPLGIEKLPIYERKDDAAHWTVQPEAAAIIKGKPKPFKKEGKPSEINHGNIAPSIREQGITAEKIVLRWAMPLAAIRRLKFGGGARDKAGQAYVVALGLVARVLDHDLGYSLRSRCDLISKGAMNIDIIAGDGTVKTAPLSRADAIAMLKEAEAAMTSAGLRVNGKVTAKPGKALVELIEANRKLQELGADDVEAA